MSETPAHDQNVSHKYVVHYPSHYPRQDDPHYMAFEAYRKATRPTAKCHYAEVTGTDQYCKGDLELHHRIIEFALINEVDLALLAKDYPALTDPGKVGAWAESPENLRWYCVAEGEQILMGDGRKRAVETVEVGDHVVGSDGLVHCVLNVRSRLHEGPTYRIPGGPKLTPNHRVLTPEGWRPVSRLTRFDQIYRLTENDFRASSAGHVDVREMHDRISEVRELRVPRNVVVDTLAVPCNPIRLNDYRMVKELYVDDIPADDGISFMPNAALVEHTEEPSLDACRAMLNGASPAVRRIRPHTVSGAIEPSHLSLGVGARPAHGLSHWPPAHSAWCSSRLVAGPRVQGDETALVGAVLSGREAFEMGNSNFELPSAYSASAPDGSAIVQPAFPYAGTFPRTCFVSPCYRGCCQELEAAYATGDQNTAVGATLCGRWRAVGDVTQFVERTRVYDLTVDGSHDFIANDIIVHNCSFHHRGHGGVHVASSSDFTAEFYVPGLIS